MFTGIINFVVAATGIFKWIGFFVALLVLCMNTQKWIREKHLSSNDWFLNVFFLIYILLFLFAPDPLNVLWLMIIFISNASLDYEDKREGRKWWEW